MEYMRKSAKVFRQGAVLLGVVSLLVAAVVVVAVLAAPASAQVPDYGKLFGTTGSEPAASQPQQSLPAGGADPGAGASAGLSAADYARIADAAPEPMLGAAQKAISLFRGRLVGMLMRRPCALDDIGNTLAAGSPTGRGV